MSDVASPGTPSPSRSLVERAVGLARSPRVYGVVALLIVYSIVRTWSSYDQFVVASIGLYAIVGAGLVLLVGVSGQLSLGHAAFLAVGAYSATNISTRTEWGLPGEIAVALAVSIVVGTIVGLPSLRLSGLYLAVGTLALGYAGQQLLYNWDEVTGGGFGQSVGPIQIGNRLYTLVDATFLLLGISFVLVSNLLRGRTGRALNAIRTAEPAARAVGIEVARRRILAFTMSSALAAVGGVLYAHAVSRVTPETFNVDLSIFLVILVIIGGQKSLLGALLGSAFVVGLPEQFRDLQDYDGLIYGAILLALIVFSPDGLVGLGQRVVALVRRRASGEDDEEAMIEREVQAAMAALEESPDILGEIAGPPDAAVGGAGGVDGDPTAAGGPTSTSASTSRSTSNGSRRSGRLDLTLPGLALQLTDVEVNYGGVRAVEGVSFTVAAGEVAGLIGPNGAGKTTLFNAVTGLTRATGRIAFGDTDLTPLSIRKRVAAGLGRTFQNLSLHEGMTPVDHVLIGAHRHVRYNTFAEMVRWPTVSRAEREAEAMALDLLELLGLTEVARERADLLPYGLQKRVDVARALASRPRILMLDEPAAGLPHDEADALIDRVLTLTRSTGTSVMIIEHNVELVSRVCDQVRVLDAGQLIADAGPAEILQDERVVEAYLGG